MGISILVDTISPASSYRESLSSKTEATQNYIRCVSLHFTSKWLNLLNLDVGLLFPVPAAWGMCLMSSLKNLYSCK